MFTSNSTERIYQHHLNETDPLLARIQRNVGDGSDNTDDKHYIFIPLILIPLAFILTIATCLILFVL